MCRRPPRSSAPWQVVATRNPVQYSSSRSQSNGSATPVILGVTLDKRLITLKHTRQVRKKAAQRLGMLEPLLNRRSCLSIRNDVMLYKQFIRLMMDYACPVWRFVARSHINKLQGLQSKCLRIVTNEPWYIGSRQIQDDLGVPYFSEHIRSLREWLQVSWYREPVSWAAWQASALTMCRPAS